MSRFGDQLDSFRAWGGWENDVSGHAKLIVGWVLYLKHETNRNFSKSRKMFTKSDAHIVVVDLTRFFAVDLILADKVNHDCARSPAYL